jgi:putative serine protease PepD
MRLPASVLSLGAAALVGGGAGAVVATTADGHDTVTITRPVTQPAVTAGARSVADTTPNALTARQVYDKAKNSVAYITAQVVETSASPFGGASTGTATGSGFVVSADGYVVTNAHVVEGARSVRVKIGDGPTTSARIVGRDTSSDLALLKVDPQGRTLTPLKLADSSRVAVGDPTYAIGNPFGLSRTLTTGVISALQRQISAPNGYSIDDVLQTDAALNPGNSGGPLLNAAGEVIGVNSQIESNSSGASGEAGNVGIGFAIPSNTVRSVVSQLQRGGTVQHAYLGVQTGDAAGGGAQVGAVRSGGPAAQGGLRQGDVITRFAGKPVQDAATLSSLVDDHKPGDRVTVQVRRGGEDVDVQVTLGQRP